jgi:hypothetical protein
MELKMTEDMIDTYIAEALENPGAAVAEASAEGRTMQHDLRETVTRLGAASPYMRPPEELRARILQATAPAAFKMEEYRKAMRDNSRYYKWGFYAAMLFMMAAGWYNVTVANQNKQMRATLAKADQELHTMADQANQQLQQLQAVNQVVSTALVKFAPNAKVVRIMDNQNNLLARAILDESSKQAIVVMPPNMVAGNTGQIVLGNDTNKMVFQATVIADPSIAGTATVGLTNREPMKVSDLSPDASDPRVYKATIMPR